MARVADDIVIVGPRAACKATLHELGLDRPRGNWDVGNIVVINLTPALEKAMAPVAADLLARALAAKSSTFRSTG
ncbi:MAG TPA: hypothetical protein VM243_08480 [Phycisphaerae bacterium]|nr:hypothetical protein [Phycisphaerae bacterium]